jgi:ATP-dependent DNA ligase
VAYGAKSKRLTAKNSLSSAGQIRKDRGLIWEPLPLGYYTEDGKLIYAGRVGTGMPVKVLADLRRRLDPLARKTSPLSVPPPRSTRFGSPLVLSRVHWVEPKLVAEITYLTWTSD